MPCPAIGDRHVHRHPVRGRIGSRPCPGRDVAPKDTFWAWAMSKHTRSANIVAMLDMIWPFPQRLKGAPSRPVECRVLARPRRILIAMEGVRISSLGLWFDMFWTALD